MAKSRTSKRAKRLRAIREDNQEQLGEKEAPKLAANTDTTTTTTMDTDMNDGNQSVPSLKPSGGVAKKLKKKKKKKLKTGTGKSRGKR